MVMKSAVGNYQPVPPSRIVTTDECLKVLTPDPILFTSCPQEVETDTPFLAEASVRLRVKNVHEHKMVNCWTKARIRHTEKEEYTEWDWESEQESLTAGSEITFQQRSLSRTLEYRKPGYPTAVAELLLFWEVEEEEEGQGSKLREEQLKFSDQCTIIVSD